MQIIDAIFAIAILIVSVVIHEVSHGYVADSLGDPTARYSGRLTLNPIKHLDLFGSILIPILTSLSGFTFGWAKPVPYNPYNLKNSRWGELYVAAAGPISNIGIAVLFGLAIRFGIAYQLSVSASFFALAVLIVQINILLAVFNLVPIPPLDGSKIMFSLFPGFSYRARQTLERYGFFFVLFFIFFLWQLIFPVIGVLFTLLTGLNVGL